MDNVDFAELVSSVREAGAIRRGEKKPSRVYQFRPADVKNVRRRLRQTQTEFAAMIGISVATLRNWEQGRRVPDGPAKALLRLASKDPDGFKKALTA